jgi:hypothetical protein
MATGTLITESLRNDALLEIPLRVRRVERVEPTNISPEQTAAGLPGTWTLLHFAVDDADAPRLAEELASALQDFGWYVDFHTAAESFVVFAGRVFRYPTGDAAARAEAEAFGRDRGVPQAQLDW